MKQSRPKTYEELESAVDDLSNRYNMVLGQLTNAVNDVETDKISADDLTAAFLDQWYAIFRVLSHFCGYPTKPKDFELTMKNIGADDLRLPCKYDNFRKVTLNKLPQNVALWRQYMNSADQYSLKQLKVAVKLMDLLHIE